MDNLQPGDFLTTAVVSIFQETFIMVSSRLLQAGIIIAAFLSMVTAFQVLSFSVIYVVTDIFFRNGVYMNESWQTIMVYLVLFMVALVILRKSGDIAEAISNKSQFIPLQRST